MCGRFGRVHEKNDPDLLASYHRALWFAKQGGVDALNRLRDLTAYNAKPTTPQPFVRVVDGQRRMELGTWAWWRSFSKKPLINARGEEAARKRTWVEALRSRRCVVPASFFYEWRESDDQPFCFSLSPRADFGIGGLWEETDDGPAFVLLTTKPNPLVAPLHDRMPLILRREDEVTWTDPATPAEIVDALIQPFPHQEMIGWPVSRLVSNIRNEGPELIAPIKIGEQQSVF